MKITRIEATSHNVPINPPLLEHALHWPLVFVRVETDSGMVGYGMTAQTQRFAVRELINKEIAPLLIGQDPLPTERLWHQMFYKLNPRTQTGAWSLAVSGVDVALWDIKGKHYKEPVWRLLGGHSATVPAYISWGLLNYSREQLVELAKGLVAEGHNKLKMVVAIDKGENPAEDAARFIAVREALGDDVELMMDANYLFSFNRALELCKRLEPYGVTWFEEPVYGNDARLLANLRSKTSIPIAAGQNEGHKWRHRDLIAGGAVDIAQPDVVYVGGYTEGLKVAHLAQVYNLPLATHCWPFVNMHLAAAVANGWRVEFHLLMWLAMEHVFLDTPKIVRATITVPDTPGVGLVPNEDNLKATQED